MINRSTNINKKNNIISSPQTIEHKMTKAYSVENPDPGLRPAQNCGGIKPVNGVQFTCLCFRAWNNTKKGG